MRGEQRHRAAGTQSHSIRFMDEPDFSVLEVKLLSASSPRLNFIIIINSILALKLRTSLTSATPL